MARKSLKDEVIMANVVNLSWRTIHKALVSKKVPEEQKLGIALEIAKKTCPAKPLVDQSKHLTIIWEIDGKRQIQAPRKSGHRLEISSEVSSAGSWEKVREDDSSGT